MKQRFQEFWLNLKDLVKVNFARNRKLYIWLGIFAALGFVLAILTLTNTNFTVSDINPKRVDANIQTAIKQNASIFTFALNRILEFALLSLFVFLLCLNRYSALLAIPWITLKAYWVIIDIAFIFLKYGLQGFVLLISYFFFLFFFLILLAALVVYIFRATARLRRLGLVKGGLERQFFKDLLGFLVVIVLASLIEWLCYFSAISFVVYP
ncbi:MAG: hypothetical protein LBM01_01615 [Christensenellaceae bacterium]|nr:hypothetical protein [Christensenellaceae bacterium]